MRPSFAVYLCSAIALSGCGTHEPTYEQRTRVLADEQAILDSLYRDMDSLERTSTARDQQLTSAIAKLRAAYSATSNEQDKALWKPEIEKAHNLWESEKAIANERIRSFKLRVQEQAEAVRKARELRDAAK